MGFTHYPKLEENLLGAWCWYGKDHPLNTLAAPLGPGKGVSLYFHAQNFTRFYGTMQADQPIEMLVDFGNADRVVAVEPATLEYPAMGLDPKPGDIGLDVDLTVAEKVRRWFPVDQQGTREITDEDLPRLRYQGRAHRFPYTPASGDKAQVGTAFEWTTPAVGDKFMVTIYGRWMQVTVVNRGGKPVKDLDVHLRASVF